MTQQEIEQCKGLHFYSVAYACRIGDEHRNSLGFEVFCRKLRTHASRELLALLWKIAEEDLVRVVYHESGKSFLLPPSHPYMVIYEEWERISFTCEFEECTQTTFIMQHPFEFAEEAQDLTISY